MNKQKILFKALSLAVLSVSLLGGCGSSGEQPKAGGSPSSTTAASPSTSSRSTQTNTNATSGTDSPTSLENLTTQIKRVEEASSDTNSGNFKAEWQKFVRSFEAYKNETKNSGEQKTQSLLLEIQTEANKITPLLNGDSRNTNSTTNKQDLIKTSLTSITTDIGQINQPPNNSNQLGTQELQRFFGNAALLVALFIVIVFVLWFIDKKMRSDKRNNKDNNLILNNTLTAIDKSKISESGTHESVNNFHERINSIHDEIVSKFKTLGEIRIIVQGLENKLTNFNADNFNRLFDSRSQQSLQQLKKDIVQQLEIIVNAKIKEIEPLTVQDIEPYIIKAIEDKLIPKVESLAEENRTLFQQHLQNPSNYKVDPSIEESLQKINLKLNEKIKENEGTITSIESQLAGQKAELDKQKDYEQLKEFYSSNNRDLQNANDKIADLEKQVLSLQKADNNLQTQPQVSQGSNLILSPAGYSTTSSIQRVVDEYNRSDSLVSSGYFKIAAAKVSEIGGGFHERRTGEGSSVILSEDTQGKYQVISVSDGNKSESEYWLLPINKLMSSATYNSTGKELFNCTNIPSSYVLFDFTLIRPARVVHHSSGWELRDKGEISFTSHQG